MTNYPLLPLQRSRRGDRAADSADVVKRAAKRTDEGASSGLRRLANRRG